jgi:DNA-binding beta-propeller fold protein YncE
MPALYLPRRRSLVAFFIAAATALKASTVLGAVIADSSSPASRLPHSASKIDDRSASTCTICFHGPDNIAFDDHGNAYVTDNDADHHLRVVRISPRGQKLAEWTDFAQATGRRSGPEGIASTRDGNLLVTDRGALRVTEYSPSGKALMHIGQPRQDFRDLGHVAVDSMDNIYVAEGGANRISKYRSSGQRILVWQRPPGNGRNEWRMPEGIGIQPNGNIVVEDAGNQRVLIVQPNGETQSIIHLRHDTPHYSSGLAVDRYGDIYVADNTLHQIQVFDAGGTLTHTVVNRDDDTLFHEGPTSIGVDRQGVLYAADGLTIVKFSLQGQLLDRWR